MSIVTSERLQKGRMELETIFPHNEDCPVSQRKALAVNVRAPEIDSDHPDLSHDALALELSKAGWGMNARYVHKWGRWFFWDGCKWAPDDLLQHYTGVREFLRSTAIRLIEYAESRACNMSEVDAEKLARWARSTASGLRSAPTVNSVEAIARSNPELVASPDLFDADMKLIGTPAGAIDLSTGELLPSSREHYLTKLAAVAPAKPGTPAPVWFAFLQRIFNGNQELIDFMQRIAGYALTGSTEEHKLFFLYGTGSNGKSVYLNTLFDIVGDYARRAPANMFLESHGDRHTTDLAGLHGARLVAGSELPAGKAWNEAMIKDLTGGDTITARFMRQDFFDFEPQFTLFIAGNHQPSFRGIDEAIRRRVVLIPFTQTIPASERDSQLPEKLKAEWPAIFRWMIEGAVAWHQNGLQIPESVAAASNDYLDAEDSIGEFISDHLVTGTGGTVSSAVMYERFSEWQEDNGIRQPWSKKAMTQALKERDIEYGRLSGGARGFKGVVLAANGIYPKSRGFRC